MLGGQLGGGCKAGASARHSGFWGAAGARGSVPRASATDLCMPATVTMFDPRIRLRMPSLSEGFQLVFY